MAPRPGFHPIGIDVATRDPGPGRAGSGRAFCDSDEPIRRRLRASSRVTFSFRSFSLPHFLSADRLGIEENRKLRAHLHNSLLMIARGAREQEMAFLLDVFLNSIARMGFTGERVVVNNTNRNTIETLEHLLYNITCNF